MSTLPLTPVTPGTLTLTGVTSGTLIAVQTGVDSIAAAGGITQLAAGTYIGGAPAVTPAAGSDIRGQGIGVTHLRNTGSGHTVTYEGLEHVTRDERISDLTIYGQNAGDANAGIYAHLTQAVIVNHVQSTRHRYGIYTDSGEQFAFYDCWFDGTVAAAWLTGATPGFYTSNYHKFYNTIFQGSPYGVVIENASGQVAFYNCPFYANTVAVRVPVTAVGVVDAVFDNCWFETNTLALDLRGGGGFTFRRCGFYGVVVDAATFNHPGLWLDSCNDGGLSTGNLVVAGADYKLTNANPAYPKFQCQVAGSYEPVERPPVRGSLDRSRGLPTDMSTWATAAATGGQADPYGGTAASVLAAGSSAIEALSLNGGAAIGGTTTTLQLRVKSNGGRVRIMLQNLASTVIALKWVGLPLNDWRFVYLTFKWPAGLADTAAYIYVTAETQSVYCYWPVVSQGPSPIPELPAGRDMSAWAGDYEVFGSNHNIQVTVNNAAPATGTWRVGDEAVNYAPAAGGTHLWRCTTAGSPGTFKAVALAA